MVQSDSHTTSVARLAAGQVDVMVSYGHIRIKNAPKWETEFGGTAPMVEQTGVIGVTEGIYNDMIAYSKNSDTMADEDFRKALGESVHRDRRHRRGPGDHQRVQSGGLHLGSGLRL